MTPAIRLRGPWRCRRYVGVEAALSVRTLAFRRLQSGMKPPAIPSLLFVSVWAILAMCVLCPLASCRCVVAYEVSLNQICRRDRGALAEMPVSTIATFGTLNHRIGVVAILRVPSCPNRGLRLLRLG